MAPNPAGSTATGGDRDDVDRTDRDGAGDDGQRQRLRSLFVDVTGTEVLVERQERDGHSRVVGVADGRPAGTLSEYVAEMARTDGLSEAFAEPDTDDTSD